MSVPLRIALIAPNRFPIREPFAGGLEAHVWHLARALAADGHRVTLFADERSGPFGGCGVTVRALRRTQAASHPFPLPGAVFESDHRAYLELMTELANGGDQEFDVVHNHSLHQVPVAMAPTLSVPVLCTLHTPPFSWLESAVGASRGVGVTFAAVSRHTAEAWSRGAIPVLVVPNGVDVDRWPAGPGGPHLVWSGRITPEKGPHLAIAAARLARQRLVLAGPIGNRDYFESKIAPHLGKDTGYAGHLGQEELAALVGNAAAALVTPVWDEPYCLVVAEAMSCGTPVVAFERGGIPELLDRQCGRLVPPNDAAAMAAAIPVAASLSRTAVRERAVRRCAASSMVASYVAVYRDLIDERDRETDDRLLRASSRPRASHPGQEHLRTSA